MLPKANRLTRKKDFDRVFRFGRDFRCGALCLRVVDNNLDISRFGFIVGKRVSKKAVVRNRIRRRIREIVRINIGMIKSGIDYVFIVRQGLSGKDQNNLGAAVTSVLNKAGILNNKSFLQ